MANISKKVFIKIESSAEQQETLNKNRKTLKVLQKAAVDKENLAGRPLLGKSFTKAKSDDLGLSEVSKRKKVENKTTQTEAHEVSPHKAITEKDLTTDENPGEHYWELLAEKRRVALDETLEENKNLYERIGCLEEELDTSRQMLDEARHLVEVLTEILNEKENEDEKEVLEEKAVYEENEDEEEGEVTDEKQ